MRLYTVHHVFQANILSGTGQFFLPLVFEQYILFLWQYQIVGW